VRASWSVPDPAGTGRRAGDEGFLSLEAVLVLPLVAMLVVGLIQVAAVGRDVLVLHEAARAGVRAAATSTGATAPDRAARAAAPELPQLRVEVDPVRREAGMLVTVQVSAERRLGPVVRTLRASAVAQVEPIVGG
jgi:hypothetical protein